MTKKEAIAALKAWRPKLREAMKSDFVALGICGRPGTEYRLELRVACAAAEATLPALPPDVRGSLDVVKSDRFVSTHL